MQPANWIILVLLIVAGIGAVLLAHAREGAQTRAAKADDKGAQRDRRMRRSWAPAPGDKYLPAWVVVCVVLSFWLLALQVNLVVKDICAVPGRCLRSVDLDAQTTARLDAAAKVDAAKAAALRPGQPASAPNAP